MVVPAPSALVRALSLVLLLPLLLPVTPALADDGAADADPDADEPWNFPEPKELQDWAQGAGAGDAGSSEAGHGRRSLTWKPQCDKCPSSSRRAAWEQGGDSEGGGNSQTASSLTRRELWWQKCPKKSKHQLAKEAISALRRHGYTKTARYLERSKALLRLRRPGTFLAPDNGAYKRSNLPEYLYNYFRLRPQGGGVSDKLMKYLTLLRFRSYNDFKKEEPRYYSTLLQRRFLRSTLLRRAGAAAGDFTDSNTFTNTYGGQVLGFRAFPSRPGSRHSVVKKKNLFCNNLVIIQGVNRLLIPLPDRRPPAPGPWGAPTRTAAASGTDEP